MIDYLNFRYLFPPRPERVVPEVSLQKFETMGYVWQPKLNGSCGCLFTNGKETIFMSRHKAKFVHDHMNRSELTALAKNSWTVLVGEYMNKSQKGLDRKVFNNKFVIFDILVHANKYLLGTTFKQRQMIIDNLYPSTYYDGWVSRISESVFRANNFMENIPATYNEIIKIGMYEGLVGKKENGKLEIGMHAANNKGWHVKVRKPTKNYNR